MTNFILLTKINGKFLMQFIGMKFKRQGCDILMTIIRNFFRDVKDKWEEFVRDFWMFHPILSFGLFLRPIVEIAQDQYSTGEAIGLAITFFFMNAFFCLMWEYKKHLIKKEKELRKRNRDRWEKGPFKEEI